MSYQDSALAGKFFAVKVIGRLPVAGIVKMTGFPGWTPKTFAPLILGFGDGSGVNMYDSLLPKFSLSIV